MLTGHCHANVNRSFSHNLIIRDNINRLRKIRPEGQIRILDVCCGKGQVFRDLTDRFTEEGRLHYTGIDLDKKSLDELLVFANDKSLREKVDLKRDSALQTLSSLADMSYALVIFVNALHEQPMKEVPLFLRQLFRVVSHPGFVSVFDIAELRYEEQELSSLPIRFERMKEFLSELGPDGIQLAQLEEYRNDERIIAWSFNVALDNDSDRMQFVHALDSRQEQYIMSKLHAALVAQRINIHEDILKLTNQWQRLFSATEPAETIKLQQRLDVHARDYWACDFEIADLVSHMEAP
ncbi:MAG: class I SAM-dependent methyltransferase [Pyrinomonadaceae bacterium]